MSPATERSLGYAAQTPAEEVRSPRLVLRRVQADDAVGIALAVRASLDYLKPWMAWATREAAEPRTQLIRVAEADDLWESGSDFIYSILLPPEQTVIGEIGLHRRVGEGGIEIGYWVDQAPPGPLRAVSICAGQGRDLIGVLREHPR